MFICYFAYCLYGKREGGCPGRQVLVPTLEKLRAVARSSGNSPCRFCTLARPEATEYLAWPFATRTTTIISCSFKQRPFEASTYPPCALVRPENAAKVEVADCFPVRAQGIYFHKRANRMHHIYENTLHVCSLTAAYSAVWYEL